MPIAVACQCGKRFQAKDELAGKRVKCPGCGNPLAIPTPQPAGGGNDLDDMFGSSAGDPLFASGPAAPAGFGPPGMPTSAGPPRPRKKKGPNMVLIAGIAGGGVGLLLILIVVLFVVFGKRRDDQVALNPTPPINDIATPVATPTPVTTPSTGVAPPAPPPTATTVAPPPPAPTPAPETVTPTPTAGSESTSDSTGDDKEKSSSRSAFPTAVTNWHAKIDATARGAIAKEGKKFEDEVIIYQMSWMAQVLPFMGYDRIHKKIDFKKSWTEGENYRSAQYRIPQFLAPGDDRKSWEGYQFPNLGLTHFVGMSGVEDARQEVAAALERTHDRAGIFGYASIAKESDITDGKNQTIMVIGSGELIGPWMAGGGVTVRGARAPDIDEKTGEKTYDYFNSLDGFGTRGQSGPQTMFADGSVRVLNPKMDPSVFRAMCTMHGKETVDLKDVGETKEKFATQDFDPFADDIEVKIVTVRRIGDGGDSSDDDDDSDKSDSDDDKSDSEEEKSDEDSGSEDK
jgi:hypothetical protein